MTSKWLIANSKWQLVYLFAIPGLFLYSYTQVDLSLTLSKISLWQTLEKWFQYIGYFNRPVSAYIYIIIIVLLLNCYIVFLCLSVKGNATRKQVWILILITAGVLTFSYNAFSYDLFNYIFDAKIFTYYHLNPYAYKALDFPHDQMLSFMHWTHRTYPYGPFWLAFTVPLSYLGLNIFLPTFFLFKMLMSVSYLGTAWLIEKILQKQNSKATLFGLIFFAMNPLVIIESLLSAHIDIVMLFFFMSSFFLLFEKQRLNAVILNLLSIGIKFATIFALPIFLYELFSKKKKLPFEKSVFGLVILMGAGVVAQSVRTSFQPWYLLDVLPIVALISQKYYVLIPSIIISFFALLQYVWFLFTGNFDSPYPAVSFWITTSSILVSGGIVVWCRIVGVSKVMSLFHL